MRSTRDSIIFSEITESLGSVFLVGEGTGMPQWVADDVL
jgi:hypothetical protein